MRMPPWATWDLPSLASNQLQICIFDALTHQIDPILRVHHLPKLHTSLVPTLASLDVKNLTHFHFFFVNCFSRESDGKLGGKICRVWESLYMFVIRNLGVLCEGFCLRWVWCWLWLLMVKSVVILIVVWLLCSY